MGDTNEENEAIEPGAAGAPEGAVAEPTTEDVGKMYEELGIKAPVPTGKPKGRPKTPKVRAKDDVQDGTGDSDAGKPGNEDDKSESKNASDSGKDGDSGDDSDSKSKKVSKDSKQVSEKSEKVDNGVQDTKPRDGEGSKPGGEKDSKQGDDGAGEADDKSEDSKGETSEDEDSEAEEGKRPGKSNPAVEKRMQQLAADRKEALERAEAAEKKLQETVRAQEQSKVAQEDPEYKIEDFRTVRDNQSGEIKELTDEQAELAWRRWKDGYDARAEERQAKANHEAAQQERESEMTRQLMQESADAYDALAALQDEYPELVSTSGKFDEDFAKDAMPIIQESLQYLEGTEPGNAEGNLPVIVGFKMNPKKILDALKKSNSKKRSLPLNGVNDNVESKSNVSVPHSRSSDPTVQAANDLYKELGIKKRI